MDDDSIKEEPPLLAKWPFYLADALAIGLALIIGFSGDGPISGLQLTWVALCIIAGAGIMITPFYIEFHTRAKLHKIDHDEEAWARVKRLEEAVDSVKEAGEAFDVAHTQAREEVLEKMSEGFKKLADGLAGAAENSKFTEKLESLQEKQDKIAESLAECIRVMEAFVESKDNHNAVLQAVSDASEKMQPMLEVIKSDVKALDKKVDDLAAAAVQVDSGGAAYATAAKLTELEEYFKGSDKGTAGISEKLEELQRAVSYIISTGKANGDAKPDEIDTKKEKPAKAADKKEKDKGSNSQKDKEKGKKQGKKQKESLMSKAFAVTPDKKNGNDSPIDRIISDQKTPLVQDETEAEEEKPQEEEVQTELEVEEPVDVAEPEETTEIAEEGIVEDFEGDVEEKAKKPLVIKQETKLIAHALVGMGNVPYIRGDGPGLNWEKGVEMDFVEIGKWEWRTRFATKPVFCTILLNDEIYCEGKNFKLDPGETISVSPQFVDKEA